METSTLGTPFLVRFREAGGPHPMGVRRESQEIHLPGHTRPSINLDSIAHSVWIAIYDLRSAKLNKKKAREASRFLRL